MKLLLGSIEVTDAQRKALFGTTAKGTRKACKALLEAAIETALQGKAATKAAAPAQVDPQVGNLARLQGAVRSAHADLRNPMSPVLACSVAYGTLDAVVGLCGVVPGAPQGEGK